MFATINFKLKLISENNTFEFEKNVPVKNPSEMKSKLKHYQEMYKAMGLEFETEVVENITNEK